MTFANIWLQIKTGHEKFHLPEEELRDRVSNLESLLRAHNIPFDGQQR
jgi:hypothetical protein